MPTYPTYKLGEIAKIYNGNSINAEEKEKKYKGVDGRNYIGTKDIDFDGAVNYNNGVRIPYNEEKFKIAPAESVLVCAEGGSAGKKSAFITEDVCFGNKLFAITNNQGLFDGKYVFYYTRYKRFFDLFKNELSGLIGGVSSKKFGEIPIPLPPLSTQRAIVARIETLFAELDKAVDKLKTARQQLKTYRQAVLNHWLNNEDGKWERVKIKDCSKNVFAGGDAPKNNFSETKTEKYTIPIYANAVKQKGLYGFTDIARVNESCVTIAGRGSGTGHTEIREEPFFPIVRLIVVIPDKNILNNQFLKYIIDGKTISITGSAIPQLTVPTVNEYEFPLPPLTEQQRIVAEIESRLSACESMEQSIAQSLAQAEVLRQSILKKAFSGELVVSQAQRTRFF